VWAADRTGAVIDETQARRGIEAAVRHANRLLHAPALRDLSGQDRAFLDAMATDPGPSLLRAIAERMEVTADYASQYRARLIAADLIEPAARGSVDFAIPFLRDYLRQPRKD
jgi:hypothetical protein